MVRPALGWAFVLVPDDPGPLVVATEKGRGELDEMLDELVGKPSIDKPGWFDLVSVISGAALILWGVFGDGPSWALALGWLLFAFGLIMPLRKLWQHLGAIRSLRRHRLLARRGAVLDPRPEPVRDLIAAYTHLVEATRRAPPSWGAEALQAAHSAMIEVATLLGGGAPGTPDEVEFIAARTSAIQELRSSAEQRLADQKQQRAQAVEAQKVREQQSRAALVSAFEEIEQTTGTGSLQDLRRITRRIRGVEDSDVELERSENDA